MAINLYSKVRVTKANLFAKMVEIMTTAGWTIVSGTAASGTVMLKSTGESGDRTLAVLMNNWIYSNADAYNLNVNGNAISVKFPGSLVGTTATYPNLNGFSGSTFYFPVISNISNGTNSYQISTASPCPYPNMEVDLYYFCNKDKFIVVCDPVDKSITSIAPGFFWFGLSSHDYVDHNKEAVNAGMYFGAITIGMSNISGMSIDNLNTSYIPTGFAINIFGVNNKYTEGLPVAQQKIIPITNMNTFLGRIKNTSTLNDGRIFIENGSNIKMDSEGTRALVCCLDENLYFSTKASLPVNNSIVQIDNVNFMSFVTAQNLQSSNNASYWSGNGNNITGMNNTYIVVLVPFEEV